MVERNNNTLPLLIEQVKCPICRDNIREKRSDKDKLWRLQCWEISSQPCIYVHGDCLRNLNEALGESMNKLEVALDI